jgi:hypothetical protein
VADEAREAVLVAVDRLGEHGGLSLRPATLHTEAAYEPGTRGDPVPGQLARILVPAGLLALVGMLVLAGVVTAVAFTVGVWLAVAVALVGMIAVGGVGAFVVLRMSRRSLVAAPALGVAWQSTQQWLGPLAQTRERRLVFVAMDTVARIAGSEAWSSPDLDEHRIRLNLLAELDDIDAQAYRLAELGSHSGNQHAEVVDQGWDALVDRVSALSAYADRLAALETEPAAAPIDAAANQLLAGSARDELASDHVRGLTRDLPDVTNSETSHRNST